MAEESRITNVEGELGVASEVTMRKLLEQMQKMAKATGKDPNGQESKVRESLTKSLLGEIKVVEGNTSKLGKLATSLHPATLGLKLMTSSVYGLSNMLGNSIRTVTGFGRELFETSTRMSDFAKHIPMVGRQLEVLAKIMDNTRDNFTQIAMSGADFNNSMSQFRISAREAGGSLEEYTRFVRENTERMAAFGGTVTRGAMQVSRMTDVMDDKLRENLLSMGLNFEDINEQMVYYQYLNRAGARTRIQDEAAQAAAAASLTKNMLTLSKLTGEDVKKRQEAIAEAQMNIAFQMEMAKMTEEQRAAVTEQMNRMSLFGEEGINAVKRSVLGMPAITEGQQAFLLANRDLVSQMEKNLGIIKSGDPSAIEDQSDFLVNALQSYVNSLNTYENMLRVGAVGGLSGIAEEMANQLNIPSDLVLKFLKVDEATGKFVLDMEALGKNMKEIQESLNPDDNEMTNMGKFLNSLAKIRKDLQTYLIEPLMGVANKALDPFIEMMEGMTEESGFFKYLLEQISPKITRLGNIIKNAADRINKGDFHGVISDVITDVMDLVSSSMGDLWNGPVGQRISDAVSGFFEYMVDEIIIAINKKTGLMGGAVERIEAKRSGEVSPKEESSGLTPAAENQKINSLINNLRFYATHTIQPPGMAQERENLTRYLMDSGMPSFVIDSVSGYSRDPHRVKKYSRGSNGFVDFGSGTPAMLHGREAVVREDSEMGQLLKLASLNGFGWQNPTIGSRSRLMSRGQGTVINQEGPPKWMGGSPRPTNSFLRGVMKGLMFGPVSFGAKLGLFADINPGMQDMPRGFEDNPFIFSRPQNPAGLVAPTDPDSSAFIQENAMDTSARRMVLADILLGKLKSVSNLAPTTSARPLPRPTVPEIRLPKDLEPEGFGDTGVNRISPSTLQAPVVDSIENLNNAITSFEESSNRTGNNSTELQKQLNTTMKEIKSALLEMRDINKRIETNTRGIATDAFSGRVTSKI